MNPADKIKRFFKNASVGTNPKADDDILNQLLQAHRQSAEQPPAEPEVNIWRAIMESKITKLAAAVVIIIAVFIGITLVNQTIPTAYALEHTIEANHWVRYLHIKSYGPEDANEPMQFWIECDEAGNIKNARLYFPVTEDGTKTVVWSDGKAQLYFKQKKSYVVVNEPRFSQKILEMVKQCDPRTAVAYLQEQQSKGEVEFNIETPADKSEPIAVTVTSTKKPLQLKLYVDQATKLVTAIDTYVLENEQYQYYGTLEFYDYNVPIEPEMFTLEDELPDDVVKIDQTTQEVGLAQGNLTDDEVAVEVAKQFFEALIAEDYEKAGQLLGGIPADHMKKLLGPVKFLRIISVDPVQPHPVPETRGVVVPVTVEIQNRETGEVTEEGFNRPGVRQVHNQPGRWTIFGGI